MPVDLRPEAPEGWATPLLIARAPEARSNSSLEPGGRLYISWAITNTGPFKVPSQFFVDLRLDGIPVERWTAQGLEQGETLVVRDWTSLPGRARLTPGEHTLTLAVDSTDLIQEENETDNTYSVSFLWRQIPGASPRRVVAPARLPNLTPFVPKGWDTPIRITAPDPKEDPLADATSPRIQVAFKNAGLSSAERFFQAHLYLNDILVAKFGERGLIAQERVITPQWSGLTSVVHLKPGEHNLTLVVDPTGRIQETDEEDNTASIEFTWAPGLTVEAAPTAAPARRRPADLAAFAPPGWDAPIVATNVPGQLAAPTRLLSSATTYVHWALKNPGDEDLERPFTLELRLDGVLVGTWDRTGLAAGQVDVVVAWPLASPRQMAPGYHRLVLLLRQPSLETEATRTELLARRTLEWSDRAPEERSLIHYAPEELRRRLAGLEGLLSSTALTSNTSPEASAETVLAIADAVYYSLNNRSLRDEPLSIHLLTGEEYTQWVAIECQDTLSRIPDGVREIYQENCRRLDGFSGYTTNWRDQHRIVLRADRPPVQLLATLAHELGHFHQSMVNPGLENLPPSLDIRALQEAQAYAYQIYFLRALERLTARDLLLYPKLEGYQRLIGERVDALAQEVGTNEHARGRLLLWVATLTDPGLRRVRNVLLTDRALTGEAAADLFTYLVHIPPQDAIPYVTRHLKGLRTQVPAISSLAMARLLPGLPHWNEGSPYLREVGLLLP